MNNVKMDDFVNVQARLLETVMPQNNESLALRLAKFQGYPHELKTLKTGMINLPDTPIMLNLTLIDARRLSCLKALLDGPAAAWLKDLEDDVINDYDTLVEHLREHFAILLQPSTNSKCDKN